MRVKNFVADDYQAALQQAKKEMGRDAIILSTRPVKKGIFSFFSKPQVEITVAVDDEIKTERDAKRPAAKSEEQAIQTPQRRRAKPETDQPSVEPSGLYGELMTMRQMIETMNARMTEFNQFHPRSSQVEKLYQVMLKNRVEVSFAQNIAIAVDRRIPAEHSDDAEWVKKLFCVYLEDQLPEIKPITKRIKGKPVIIFMVGPTGVGKTTTIAKLAAQMVFEDKRNVAFITLDTYRISAATQLRTYADIIQVPVQVVLTMSELEEALKLFNDREVIFVDTAGRSPFNEEQMQELEAFVKAAQPDETMLVLSATMNYEDMYTHYTIFSRTFINKLIFTKFDETRKIGGVINLLLASAKPLAYVANGQNVPDDIIIPDKLSLIQGILSEGT
jgi:flagellar biosynthesis protein FlhF